MKKVYTLLAVLLFPFLLQAQDSLRVSIDFHWIDTTIVGSGAYNNAYNEVWGFVQGNREYAVIGSTDGTHIFDVSTPASSYEAAFIPGKEQGPIIIHRDFHDYEGYLYIACDEGNSSLQIADLSFLPDSVHVVYDSDSLMKTSHNLFIDEQNDLMYACGGQGMGNSLDVYSLANPEVPELIIRAHGDVTWWNPTIGNIHDIYVRDNIAYLNAGNNGFFVVDFSDVQNPVLLGSLTSYVQQGYNHSGWLNETGDMYAMADETWGMDIKLLDVSDFDDITVIDTIDSETSPTNIVHNLIIHGDYMFVSYYYDGLYIWNVCDPENPLLVGFYDTTVLPHINSYQGAWGVYPMLPSGKVLLSDMQNGLYIFDVSEALNYGDANVICTVGENELPNTKQWQVFPNPVADRVRIAIPNASYVSTNWTLADYSGRLVAHGNVNGNLDQIDLSGFKNGVYFLTINQGNTSSVEKLIKVN